MLDRLYNGTWKINVGAEFFVSAALRRMIRFHFIAVIIVFGLIGATSGVRAQTLKPHAYPNVPVVMNFLPVGDSNSKGALLFDPALPITDARVKFDEGLLAYVRILDVVGKSARAGVILPCASLYTNGFVYVA